MSMQGDAGVIAATKEVKAFIEEGVLECLIGRKFTDADRQVLAPILERLRQMKESAESGWY